jgi:type IV protein arginine methyltransferase
MRLEDETIQRYEPEEHTIVEAHPEVYVRILKLGWGEKKNVRNRVRAMAGHNAAARIL